MQGADCMKKKVKRTWAVTRRQPDKAVMYDITALFDGCIYSFGYMLSPIIATTGSAMYPRIYCEPHLNDVFDAGARHALPLLNSWKPSCRSPQEHRNLTVSSYVGWARLLCPRGIDKRGHNNLPTLQNLSTWKPDPKLS